MLKAHATMAKALEQFQIAVDADLAALLQSELEALLEAYQKRKEETGGLDFDDLLMRARDLVRDVLAACDRGAAGQTAPAEGLYFEAATFQTGSLPQGGT